MPGNRRAASDGDVTRAPAAPLAAFAAAHAPVTGSPSSSPRRGPAPAGRFVAAPSRRRLSAVEDHGLAVPPSRDHGLSGRRPAPLTRGRGKALRLISPAAALV